ncbi:MAG TPA: SET domain-containing protein-lysine N-methyltransferase [Edaphocola sp.]|nr:SET domain-containing protein-lysine N-methyltransferase [Edaphocola sp.]
MGQEDRLFVHPRLIVLEIPGKGLGVFTRTAMGEGEVVEISPVLVMPPEARTLLDQTALHDYIFEWGWESRQCCVAWGYISLYNHSYTANCEHFMDFDNNIIMIRTVRAIDAGEELTINYNGAWNETRPVWFDVQ